MSQEKAGDPNIIEKGLGFFIPGYKGYRESEPVAEADRGIREFISKNIDDLVKAVDARKREVMNSPGGLSQLPGLETITNILKRVSAQIRFVPSGGASYGYKTYDYSVCEKLKAFDESLYMSLQEAKNAVEKFREASGAAATEELLGQITGWADRFSGQLKSRDSLFS